MRENSASAKSTFTENPAPAELPAVELDPPTPPPAELVHWLQLAERYVPILHDGDASAVVSAPRPYWSDPDRDIVGKSGSNSGYRSALVKVPVSSYRGRVGEDGELEPAYISSSVQQYGDGVLMLSLSMRWVDTGGEWVSHIMKLFPDEAAELAQTLLAGIALATGGQS